jgi:hypothetical protein
MVEKLSVALTISSQLKFCATFAASLTLSSLINFSTWQQFVVARIRCIIKKIDHDVISVELIKQDVPIMATRNHTSQRKLVQLQR